MDLLIDEMFLEDPASKSWNAFHVPTTQGQQNTLQTTLNDIMVTKEGEGHEWKIENPLSAVQNCNLYNQPDYHMPAIVCDAPFKCGCHGNVGDGCSLFDKLCCLSSCCVLL